MIFMTSEAAQRGSQGETRGVWSVDEVVTLAVKLVAPLHEPGNDSEGIHILWNHLDRDHAFIGNCSFIQ